MSSKYAVVSGVLFGVVAVIQAVRALYQWPVNIGGVDIPVWGSWAAVVVTGGLCAWAFQSGRK